MSLRIFLNWSLFSLLAVLESDNRRGSVVTISRPPTSSSLKIRNRSLQHAAPHLWSKLILSVSLIHTLVFYLLTTLHMSDPHCHHHHFHHQSLLFFTPDLKIASSSSLFHHRLLHRYSLEWSNELLVGPFSLAYRICDSAAALLAILAMQSAVMPISNSVCLSVRPSHAGTLSRRMKLGSCGLHCEVAESLLIPTTVRGRRPIPPKICAQSDPPRLKSSDLDQYLLITSQP